MLSVIRRITIGTVILLIMPALVWISGWSWKPGQVTGWLSMLYWIIEVITKPLGIITHVLLCAWFLWCLRFSLRPSVILFSVLSATILLGQGIKFWLKDSVREPRPFVIWLEETCHIQSDKFYNLKDEDRIYLINTQVVQKRDVPNFLRKYWQKETGFAFPSGHTIFTSSWALLSIGLLWSSHCIGTIFVLLMWTISIMSSRLLLGMHWPQDLMVATLISWLLAIFTIWLVNSPIIFLIMKKKF